MADQTRQWKELCPSWVKWRLAWDADNLYLCSESQRLPGEDLVCRYRDQTLGGDTVLDDSIEVHFSPVGRNAVGRKLPWAAQAILNPLGVGFYSKFTWAVAAKTTAWVPEWTIGSKIHEKSWVIELKIPRASLDVQEPNKPGDPWSLLLARNWKRTGWQQSALPAALHSFQNPREHPFAYLTDGPFARLEDVSGLVEGRIHTVLRLGTCGSKAEKANVHSSAISGTLQLPPLAPDVYTWTMQLRDEVARLLVAHGTPGYGSYSIGAVREGEVVLRLNIIQAPLTLQGDHAISFGLLPTPMRKMAPGWRMLNTSFSQNFADSFSTGRNLSRGEYYNASLMPASYEKSRILMFRNTEGMITNLGGFEFAPHTERGGYETLSADAPARDYSGPEWSQNAWTPSFQNHLFWNMQKWIDQGGLTGIHHDQFCPHPVTNRITGAAWTLPDGRTNRGYNMLLDRAYNVREHALFLENNIAPRIFCHTTNGGQVIAYPWVSAILDGEDNNIPANADYDFADIYSPARMQAYGSPWPWGNTFFWMRLIAKGNDGWQKRQDNAYLGWTVLHDVMYANGVERVLRPMLFEWGMNDRRVRFWPYWRNRQVVSCSNPDVLVSLWTLPDRALLCAFNTSKAKVATGTAIRVPLEDLGLMPKVRSEYIRGTGAPFDAWSGKFTVDIPPHDFRMLDIRKYVD